MLSPGHAQCFKGRSPPSAQGTPAAGGLPEGRLVCLSRDTCPGVSEPPVGVRGRPTAHSPRQNEAETVGQAPSPALGTDQLSPAATPWAGGARLYPFHSCGRPGLEGCQGLEPPAWPLSLLEVTLVLWTAPPFFPGPSMQETWVWPLLTTPLRGTHSPPQPPARSHVLCSFRQRILLKHLLRARHLLGAGGADRRDGDVPRICGGTGGKT